MTHGASKSPKSHKSGGQKSQKSTKPSKSPSFRSKSRTRVRYVDVYHQVSSSYSLLPKPFHCRPIFYNQITGIPVDIAINLDDLVNLANNFVCHHLLYIALLAPTLIILNVQLFSIGANSVGQQGARDDQQEKGGKGGNMVRIGVVGPLECMIKQFKHRIHFFARFFPINS